MRFVVLLLIASLASAAEQRLEWTTDRELVVHATLDGRVCLLLIDTGATHSVLDKAFCRKQGMALKAVAGSTTTVSGSNFIARPLASAASTMVEARARVRRDIRTAPG